MNGAEALLKTLVASGVDICFANPGTSEMQLVSAIGRTDAMSPILCLFEGVVTGAADGYARMADKPAATLLHVGSGFSNAMANLHNARRAKVPIVNIVGDHATYHMQYDAPLTTDVPAHAKICSAWFKVAESADDLSAGGAQAVQEAMRGAGAIATLIVPADHAWNPAAEAAPALPTPQPDSIGEEVVASVAKALRNGKPTALILGGRALREHNLATAGRIAEATGVTLLGETFPARLQRGAGRVPVQRLPYFGEQVVAALQQFEQLILVGTTAPVSFFAYPGKPSWLAPEGSEICTLATANEDISAALNALAEIVGASESEPTLTARKEAAPPSGPLTAAAIGASMSALLPEQAIVTDEGATLGLSIYAATAHAAPHDWLTLTGGAIGYGLPVSLGAAIASPKQKVIALQADGSAMYTIQALWTMARENADVTVVLLNNRSYAILNIELQRVGAGEPNAKTLSMLDLSNPDMSFVDMARGMGLDASRAESAEEFHRQFAAAMASRGPQLIEAMVAE